MSREKICGIYIFKFPNNKVYIGQSWNIKERIWKHKSDINIKRNINHPLYNAIRKYGWVNIRKEIIVSGLTTQDQLDFYERFWINLYDSRNKRYFGYNIESGGVRNKPHSKETKRKISLRLKKIMRDPNERMKRTGFNLKPILQFDTFGNFVMEFKSIIEAGRYYGIYASNINKVCKGYKYSYKNSIWKYKN